MIDAWIIIPTALAYLCALFLIAWIGDRLSRERAEQAQRLGGERPRRRGRPVLYALSLAIYCTSWTFFGSVGLAATTGLGFLPIYIGPILMFAAFWPLLIRVVRLAKSQNTTSIADFLAARYGKSQALAAIAAGVAVLGVLPYLSLQLKAVALSLETMIGKQAFTSSSLTAFATGDIALAVTLLMIVFAILFGTRHIDATEHQEGLIVAIAAESVVKIAAFLAVGAFITWGMFAGLSDMALQAATSPAVASILSGGGMPLDGWLAATLLSFCCILLLPRQFHVAVVESNSEGEVRRAAWLFPIYLIAINLFVVPIAIAGLLSFPEGSVDADMFVLALPLSKGAHGVALLAFIGGLSAATAMVIVESVALAIMVCNGIAVPLLLLRRQRDGSGSDELSGPAIGPLLIRIRRIVIVAVLGLAYIFFRTVGQTGALASIGLLSFAAVTQLAPAFFGGLLWRRATARGAIAGIVTGFVIWAYTLLLPWVIRSGWGQPSLLADGPLGIGLLRPEALLGLGLQPLSNGVLWSLAANIAAYVLVSLARAPEPIERLQANIFVNDGQPRGAIPAFRLWRTSVTVDDLRRTTARYLGEERAERSFGEYAASKGIDLVPHAEADIQILRFTEYLLASAIGAPSARLVLSLLLRRRSVGDQSSLRLLDDASEALQYNRDLLQSAIDQVRQGLAVFDRDMRLVCWNRQFRELLELPAEFGRVGAPIDRILRFLAERGDLGAGDVEALVRDRVRKLAVTNETYQERRILGGRRVLEVRTSLMPQGGFVTTYSDITERVAAAEALERANETLERRVRDRTAELTEVNRELAEAKAKADEANIAKTRFLAAASHDILQPLNAARLYATSLVERGDAVVDLGLARNIDASLESVEEILGALIEISRLDAGRLMPEPTVVPLQDLFEQMRREFAPAALNKGLELRIVATGLNVRSDRRMLRRILQNLVSNALKYTERGTVLVGCRRQGGRVLLQVYDTGPGIPEALQAQIFKEFERLPQTSSAVRGLGLGLSIVERMGRILEHPITVSSTVGRGTRFQIELPRTIPAPRIEATQSEPARAHAGIEGLTALCIDNDASILDGMRTLLSTWGLEVITAASEAEALALLSGRHLRPDIVLADYHLDEGTGLDAIGAIRQELGGEVPAAIITADHTPEIQAEVRRQGLPLLRKPLKAAQLRAVLAQVSLRRAAAE